MATIRKFLFETSFDPSEPEEAAEELPPPLTEEDVAAARDAGFAEGRRAGFEEGRAAGLAESLTGAERMVAQALERIAAGLAEIDAHHADFARRCQADAVLIARAIAARALAPLRRDHALEAVAALVRDAVPMLLDEPRLVVRVDGPALEAIRPRIEETARACGFHGRLTLLADDTLGEGDCRIEWADGGLDRDTGRLWDEIDHIVGSFVDGLAAEAAPQSEEGMNG